MRIGGLRKLSLIDFPGKTCAVIFTQGCNFRCSYCHNPELVYPESYTETIPFENILHFLKRRQGLLDGVVISGGEPTQQSDLIDRIRDLTFLGYAVKIDTNGSNPDILAEALAYVDYVAMDIKAPLGGSYRHICRVEVDNYNIGRSMMLLKSSGVRHEFRTTFDANLLTEADLADIRRIAGESKYTIQPRQYFKK